ncbi:MAG: cation ABC transporter substrate-binding protein, partial [Acidimicrobiales bacterium]
MQALLHILQTRNQVRRAALCLAVALLGCACSSPAPRAGGTVVAVGAENEYANVISQIGGRYVKVSA